MVLFLVTLHQQKKIKIFSFKPGTLELGLDFVNMVKAQGHKILSSHVVDENGATAIPLEIFDGSSFSAPIQALEKQWIKILKKASKETNLKPLPLLVNNQLILKRGSSQHTKEYVGLLCKKIQLYSELISHMELTSIRLKRLYQQAEKEGCINLLNHYQTLIYKSQQSITKAENVQTLSVNKLHQFQQVLF